MISIAFKADYTKEEIKKISIFCNKDSFTYALFNEASIVESGRFLSNELTTFLDQKSDLNADIHYASKSRSFTFIDPGNVSKIKDQTNYYEVLNLDPDILCCYNDDNIEVENGKLTHFSTLIHQYYKLKTKDVIFTHFEKSHVIIAITGKESFKFYNEYEIETAEDALYYIKSLMTTMQLKDEESEVVLSGYIEDKSIYHKLLYKHFSNIIFAHHSILKSSNENVNLHSYFDHVLNVVVHR